MFGSEGTSFDRRKHATPSPLFSKLFCESLVRGQIILADRWSRPEKDLFKVPVRDLGRVHLGRKERGERAGGCWCWT